MVVQARVIWDEAFAAYDFGPGHPMSPLRLELTALLCRELGLFDDRSDHTPAPPPGSR